MDEQQLLGAPYKVEWNGRELRFGLLGQQAKASFVAALKSFAIAQERERLNIEYPGEEHAKQRAAEEKEFRDDMRAGLYAWGGAQATRWWSSNVDGDVALMRALLEEGGTPLSDADARQFRVEQREKWAEILTAILWDSESPKTKRPA